MSRPTENVEPGDSNGSEEPFITEHDDKWTAVEAFQYPHLNPKSAPYSDAIDHAISYSLEKGLEDISVGGSQGKFLSVQCQIMGAKQVLEIGTLGAYSTIWMASASPEIRIVTLEIDAEIAQIARENIRYAGLEDRIEIIVGAALDVLPRLAEEVANGKRERFDFSFIDADKANALPYFDWAVKMTRSRGVVYVDNMVRMGQLADEQRAKRDASVRGIRAAVEGIGKDTRVNAVLLQTVSDKNYDGFLMAVVK